MSELVDKARSLAFDVLRDEVRSDGTPFIGHPDAVAKIVDDELGLSENCVAAVYLHEATCRHQDVDMSAFPEDVRNMASCLNKISTIRPKDTRLEAENYKRLIVQYSSDPRVTVMKLADRLEVMRSLDIFPKSAREQKLLETLMLYIPLAHQLGLYNLKGELENIYFRYTNPEAYRSITNKLKAGEKDREKLMQEFIEPLKKKLTDAGIVYKLKMRTKAASSIYKKMCVQNVPFEKVYDVFAIRFIIDCDSDPEVEKDLCWKVYSYVTEEYEPDTKRLRDWITVPKPNGYESLHITVHNRQGNALEVQIRTRRMDDEAENGAAAHWAYKGVQHAASLDRWMQSARYALEHPYEADKDELPVPPGNEIFVFTPSGELRILTDGSSVLDFAFNIHSGLGCKCTGGRVNGRAVSIKEKLKTGDVVEIMTSKNQRPGNDWLNWVVTSKAKTKIRQELAADERKKAAEGKEILDRRLKNWKLEFPDDARTEFMKAHKISSSLALLSAIADDELDVNEIKAFIQEREKIQQPQVEPEAQKTQKPIYNAGDDILVLNARDVKGLEYKMAHCCNPVFGDDVFGFVTRTEGIKIHRMSCPNASRLLDKYPYRIQKVRWQDTAEGGNFQANLSIIADSEHSVVPAVMDVVGQFKVSLRALNVNENQRNGTSEISLRLLVPSNLELDKVISQISLLKAVSKVKRV